MPLDASNKPQTTSSFTAFALAPGLLKTTMPFFVASDTGILSTPAPALPMHFKSLVKSD